MHFQRYLFFLVIFLISISISLTSAFLPPTEEGEDQEEKYRPMIRCLVCENMVKRLIHKMNTTHKNLGASVRGGDKFSSIEEETLRLAPAKSNIKQQKLRKATVSAWAHELVTTQRLCRYDARTDDKDPFLKEMNDNEAVKGPKAKIYCEQALEATEDELIKFAVARKMNESVAAIDMNETSQGVCGRAKYCTFRGEIKQQMESAQEHARQQFMDNYPLWKMVLVELRKNAWWYVLLFVGTIVVVTLGMVVYKYLEIRTRIRERRYQEAMERLRRDGSAAGGQKIVKQQQLQRRQESKMVVLESDDEQNEGKADEDDSEPVVKNKKND